MAPRIRISRVKTEPQNNITNKQSLITKPVAASELIVENKCNKPFEARMRTQKEDIIIKEEKDKLENGFYNMELSQLLQKRRDILRELQKINLQMSNMDN